MVMFYTKDPTPGEWKVIAFCLMVACIGLGTAGLVFAGPRIRLLSGCVLGFGVLIGAGWMIVRRRMP